MKPVETYRAKWGVPKKKQKRLYGGVVVGLQRRKVKGRIGTTGPEAKKNQPRKGRGSATRPLIHEGRAKYHHEGTKRAGGAWP